MRTALPTNTPPARSHRPRAITVFAAAFVAGAAAAVGVNRTLDVRMAQSKPRVESEAIFVALRSLPQGSPVTVWDVALRDWPKAMMPATALRASDTFSGHVLKQPLREGQPLLSIQLAPSVQSVSPAAEPTVFPPPAAYTQSGTPVVPAADGDLWSPATPAESLAHPPVQSPTVLSVSQAAPPASTEVAMLPQRAIATTADTTAGTTATPETTTSPVRSMPVENAVAPAPAVDAVVADPETDPVVPAPYSTAEPITVPEMTAATPAVSASSDVGPSAAAAPVGDIPEPFAPLPTLPIAQTPIAQTPIAQTPIAVAPPTPPSPVQRPRPVHSRFLVVPERIAVQADTSFAARTPTPQQFTEVSKSPSPQTASPSAPNAVRPLPATTAADRGQPQSRSQGNTTQGRAPQRHGRQAQPENPAAAPGTPPQPRLGSAMFPNLSAGIDSLEGRIRGEQPAQGQAPADAQSRPLTTR